MITEDENILNIIKILRTRIEDKKDHSELFLLHQAKDKENLIIADELKFWEKNELMKVTVSIEKKGENIEEDYSKILTFFEGKFRDDFLMTGLPLPTGLREEVVLISVKDDAVYNDLEQRLGILGFKDIMKM